MKEKLTKTLFNAAVSALSGLGIVFIFSPFLLRWWIAGDHDRYLWIINGPYPYSHFGSALFQLAMFLGLFLTGILLSVIALILRKNI